MTPIAPHVSDFLLVRLPVERNASPHTWTAYAHAFQLLFEFASLRLRAAPSQLALEQIDAPLIMGFLEHLETRRGNGVSSRNARLAAIKSLFRYLEHRVPSALDQIRRVLAIPSKKATSRLVPYLTREEAQAVINAPPTTAHGLRDRAMLHVAVATGIRVSELVGLRLDDLTLTPRPCLIVRGKGRRERVLPLWKESAKALRQWLQVRVSSPSGAALLFVNGRGGPLTRSGFAYVLAKHVASAATTSPALDRKRVSPHVLRHTCAMVTLQATRDVRKVALWLGHARVDTTEVYLRADPVERMDVLASVAPFGLRPGRFKPPADELMATLAAVRSSAPSGPAREPPICAASKPTPRRKPASRSA
ncbi:MAG: tyrosine-type recombinase/integrase [Gemmatimonadaceae bacterium]|nr:tyrosine-type recombinase/integrase [Gemmatimonadaceae bacterium]MBP9147105.1 tyrosine-type recombinase/integrase [Thermoanaerobaculia bacterium]